MSKHFEITVLGSSISSLVSAALLARHGFRVLVVGMRHRDASYTFEGVEFARRMATIDYGESPTFQRILAELGQVQAFPRRVEASPISYQVVADGVRMNVCRDESARRESLERTFLKEPAVVASANSIDRIAREIRSAMRELLESDFSWPVEGFLKKNAAEKRLRMLPFLETTFRGSPLLPFDEKHVLARAMRCIHRSGEVVETQPRSAFSIGHTLATWSSELLRPTEGADSILKFLAERVTSDGGEVRLRDRVESLEHDGSRVNAIHLVGEGTKLFTDWLVTSESASLTLELLLRGGTLRAQELAEFARISRRFVLSVIVRTEGLPPLLAERAVIIGEGLIGDVLLERTPAGEDRERLTLLCDLEEAALPRAREAMLALLEKHFPFIERHYLFVDSPHDGRPIFVYKNGARREFERTVLKSGGGSVEREPMEIRSSLAGKPFTGDLPRPFLKNLVLVGESVVAGCGTEGGLLSAVSAVAWLKDRDPQKGRLRRKNWTKIEIG